MATFVVGIRVCGKELEERSGEVMLFLVGEDAEAVAPRPGL